MSNTKSRYLLRRSFIFLIRFFMFRSISVPTRLKLKQGLHILHVCRKSLRLSQCNSVHSITRRWITVPSGALQPGEHGTRKWGDAVAQLGDNVVNLGAKVGDTVVKVGATVGDNVVRLGATVGTQTQNVIQKTSKRMTKVRRRISRWWSGKKPSTSSRMKRKSRPADELWFDIFQSKLQWLDRSIHVSSWASELVDYHVRASHRSSGQCSFPVTRSCWNIDLDSDVTETSRHSSLDFPSFHWQDLKFVYCHSQGFPSRHCQGHPFNMIDLVVELVLPSGTSIIAFLFNFFPTNGVC